MILSTLYHLGKFEAKRDEGYFIGYSMSSKAFRVFNKRTKRVEENLHVDFLENKAIEKDAGPNWLFDIDSLTKSMNYVPVVVTGTNSTNFSGTKDSAGQEVKKNVSSLRYIALPNWIHENNIDDKGYWDSSWSRHMIGNISYLSDYEPFDGGYVSFGQGGCNITGKGTIKTGKLEFENVYFVKDL
nr:ribonuclease H-like domain-containing protein [Tanacetum cinerariifolium]